MRRFRLSKAGAQTIAYCSSRTSGSRCIGWNIRARWPCARLLQSTYARQEELRILEQAAWKDVVIQSAICFSFRNPHSPIRNPQSLESFGVPVRLLQAAFAYVFEKFIDRREQEPGAVHVHPHFEIKF